MAERPHLPLADQSPVFSTKVPDFSEIPPFAILPILGGEIVGWAVDLSGYHSICDLGSSADIQFAEIEIFAQNAEMAWTALQRQHASRITDAELDHLFARFVLGLTSPAYADAEPSVHFEICRALVGLKLPPERARAALHTVPEPTEAWVEGAFESVELQGAKMGQALAEQKRSRADA